MRSFVNWVSFKHQPQRHLSYAIAILELLQYSSTLSVPDSVYARFDIVSNTCHPAPCYLKSNKVFLILSDRYCNLERESNPGLGVSVYLNLRHNLNGSATSTGVSIFYVGLFATTFYGLYFSQFLHTWILYTMKITVQNINVLILILGLSTLRGEIPVRPDNRTK